MIMQVKGMLGAKSGTATPRCLVFVPVVGPHSGRASLYKPSGRSERHFLLAGAWRLWQNDAQREDLVKSLFGFFEYRRISLLLVAVALFLMAPGSWAQNAGSENEKNAASPAGNADAGKKLFIKDGCYECHGREGQGAAQASGPRIGPSQRFIRPFINYVRQPTGQMPPYTTAVISDQELTDIYAYLQSRSRATPSKDIPLLNQ